MSKKQVILVILDGWGVGPKNEANPIFVQGTPNIDFIKENYPIGALQTSGISIGLPFGIQGNTEGHQTLGAGRVIYQHYPRITLAIRDGSFAANKVFLDAFAHVKKNQSALNLAGLITEGNIHASLQHVIALVKLAGQHGVEKINLHLFTDGKDSEPTAAPRLIGGLLYEAGSRNAIGIGSMSGRYYALERKGNWDRTKKAYDAIIGAGPAEENLERYLQASYEKNLTDLYIDPRVIDADHSFKDGDALLFFNFREDAMRQLASAFAKPDFSEFSPKKFNNVLIASMTQYADDLPIPAAFPPEKIKNSLGQVLADHGKLQMRISETEKYAHVTYFFNSFRQEPFKNEFRIIVPSPRVIDYAQKPEMQAREITARTEQAILDGAYDFTLVNYPNGDMVAHSGNFDAAREAVKTIDEEMGKLMKIASDAGATLLITSDHGNIELMRDPVTGAMTTTHDPTQVPVYLADKKFARKKTKEEIDALERITVGTQADIAPTILAILDIPKPEEMTGESLIKRLQ